jgi:hypothetical protein
VNVFFFKRTCSKQLIFVKVKLKRMTMNKSLTVIDYSVFFFFSTV